MKIPVFSYLSIPSTNDTAFDLHRRGELPPFVVVAVRQTQGRGRGTHTWVSPEGGLWFSVALGRISSSLVPGLSLWTAYCTAKRLRTLTGLRIQLKLPNDLFLDGKKLGGILIEIRNTFAVAGIGINTNVTTFPSLLKNRAISFLQVLGQRVEHEAIYPWIAEQLWKYIKCPMPPTSWLSEVNEWLWGRGQLVAALVHDQRVRGVLEGVTTSYELVLRTSQGRRSAPLLFLRDFEVVSGE